MATPRKLTRKQSMELIKLRANGATYADLGKKFGISSMTVYRYIKYPTWDDERKPIKLKPCGTSAAYQRHQKNGEIACLKCCEAEAVRRRIPVELHKPKPELKPCGTDAAALRHRRRGEKLDDECAQAERDANRRRRDERKKKKQEKEKAA